MATPLLQMQGISKRFPGVIALNNVSLEIYPGEIVALIGENGAGKSTLMKILGGVHQPDEGQILIDGQPLVIKSVNDSIGAGIGFIHQELNVLDNLDVASNVYLGREPLMGGPLKLVDSRKMHNEAQVYLDRLGLGISSRTPLDKISIAQQQMVEIARTLSQKARLLIMDEPTSSLTLTETQRLLEVTKELRSQGVSIIYISHRLGEVTEIADRVVALRDGNNAGGLAREEISHDRMVRLMVGRDLERFYAPPPQGGEKKPILEVENLHTRRYPNRSVSFDVRQGEILGMAGLVGAGRSEVAQAIFGVEPPLSGTVVLSGIPLNIHTPQIAIKHGIYLIPEDRRKSGLVLDMAIRENVTLPALSRYSKFGLIERAAESTGSTKICETLNVKTPSVEVNVGNLSGGNQQKVVLAKWLSLDPKVLIFDEPTRGIDVGAKAEIYKLMRSLAENGVAVIMISSDMEEVLGESDRIAVMHEGAITGILEREAASEEAIMELAVGGAKPANSLASE
ncbi:MAG: sugar ABC transporter ATP-binding protein [Abitibacteriaceae bacterium]|nr:sugar ABC transporter ATP-binding protein [Abditibacteriaceae bacterium]MBV9865500.1 sugar ABC transporter ATP-binding protein [Abditibacteriaceae bacterium]